MKITAAIITLNEEENILAACKSVSWADEILVIDSHSSDATVELATKAGARVLCRDWPGFVGQKQYAVEQARHDWIFSLDADERVSDELLASIERLRNLADSELADGYRIARRAFYQGRWIRGGGWYPDWQLRLFKKTCGHWEGAHVHESVRLADGARLEALSGDILHLTKGDAAYHHRMIGERYAPLAAQQMFESGYRTSPIKLAVAAPAAFLQSYVLKAGFRDGMAGLSIAGFAAHHAFLKHLMLWEKQQQAS